ncbi:transcription termination factor 4, mitochondrial isoform X2 [Symphalangus syndactylus]|uniref:transcription termination factor 4, mitochondrial isoform X2 n=1 Tax=Symphalangus syndactylus TaxID=9590 RepID=UPI0030073D2B
MVLDWHRLIPLTWACMARQTPHLGEQRRTTASLLRKLTTASNGGVIEELSCVRSNNYVQEPECRRNLVQCLLEKQETPVEQGSLELERVISSLLDMGFSSAHVNELLSVQRGASPQQLLDIISEFILLGLNPEPVCVVLKKSPQLLKLPIMQMRKRSSYLRKLGLGEGKLKRVLYCCPEIFTMRQQDINDTVRLLKEKCLFTVQQVTKILHSCPSVLREDLDQLEYKFQNGRFQDSVSGTPKCVCVFQYAYFRMGIKHPDIVKTEYLQYSLTKIKQRHIYLERLGRYQTPDKKGQTQIPNPLLKDILRVSEAEFLARTACTSVEEFEVFKKLLAREEEESESSTSDDKRASLDEDAEDDDEDEEDDEAEDSDEDEDDEEEE